MVLSYLRWEAAGSFGVLTSTQCTSVLFQHKEGLAITGAAEAVLVWNIKQQAQLARLAPDGAEYRGVGAKQRPLVSVLAMHPTDSNRIAAGYTDGTIRMWNIHTRHCQVTLTGHRGAVTALTFSRDASRLFSGGADTELVAWDIVAETGLFRLRGHKAPITHLTLLEHTDAAKGVEHGHLLSSSKDTLVKVWELDTQSCVQTLVGHRAEVTAMTTTSDERMLVTGAAEGPLRVWNIHPTGRGPAAAAAATQGEKKIKVKTEPGTQPAASSEEDKAASTAASSTGSTDLISFWGFLPRESSKRVSQLSFWPARSANPTLLLCLSSDKQLEMFHVRSAAEVDKKVKRRIKRHKEKQKKQAANAGDKQPKEKSEEGEGAEGESSGPITHAIPIDQFHPLLPLRTSVKIASFSASASASNLRLLFAMQDNSLQVWSVDLQAATAAMEAEEKEKEAQALHPAAAANASANALSPHYTQLYSLTGAGHRTGVRVVALNSDSTTLMTASSEQVKIWNVHSRQCIRTMDSGYALCGFFVPGSRHVIIGTKAGDIELYDLATGGCIQKVAAHVQPNGAASPVYALDLRPDQKGFASGGGDKEVKVWDFELVLMKASEDAPPVRSLQIVHTKTLKLTDDILCLKHSPDGKLLAAGLLDSTIKLFYADSLKFFLSLYGHKLPVMSIDISSDSSLLLSGSADKNVKLWGLDFGDCHKSLFAHQDSVTSVRFLRRTHLFFTAGKDKLVKLWDGDTFQEVQVLEGHTAEIWGLATQHHGTMIVTAGHDKSIRVYEQSDEQLFVEEERETRLEKLYEQGATVEQKAMGEMAGAGLVAPSESALVARTTAHEDSLKAGERLMEAMDLADADRERWQRYDEALADKKAAAVNLAKGMDADGTALTSLQRIALEQRAKENLPVPQLNPLIRGANADAHLMHALVSIPTAELDEALLVLPFDYVCRLLPYLNRAITAGVSVELCVHCLLFLLSAHHKHMIANQIMVDTLRQSRDQVRAQLQKLKQHIGFNTAAIQFVQRQDQESKGQFFFGEKHQQQTQIVEPHKKKQRRH